MTQISSDPVMADEGLQHFPITLFAASMGYSGWAVSMRAGAQIVPELAIVADIVRVAAVIVFIALTVIYVLKLAKQFSACAEEWSNPARLPFFSAFSISLLLGSIAYWSSHAGFATGLWAVGTVVQGAVTFGIISTWVRARPFDRNTLGPAWFIPAVGNAIVPITGTALGFIELSWFFMSIGLVFWLILLTVILQRLMFDAPLPSKMVPSLAIMFCPPALVFQGYVGLTGEIDAFARLTMNVAYVFVLLVLMQVHRFIESPFSLSWWALSFPVAALTTASLVYGTGLNEPVYVGIGFATLVFLSIAVIVLTAKTLQALLNGVFGRPEG